MSTPDIQLTPSLMHMPSHEQKEHVVQLYTDDSSLIDVLSPFIGGALTLGDPAVVIATKSHHTELAKRLSSLGFDTAGAAMQGRYVILDATETLPKVMVNGAVDETRFNDIIGGVLTKVRSAVDGKAQRVTVFGELVALLWAEGKPEQAIKIEQLWNDLATVHSLSLLCAYPIMGFNNDRHFKPFLKMCCEHSGVVPSESYLGLGSEEERLRSIAQLQQKAQALEKELALRQSEERFRVFVEAVQDLSLIHI